MANQSIKNVILMSEGFDLQPNCMKKLCKKSSISKDIHKINLKKNIINTNLQNKCLQSCFAVKKKQHKALFYCYCFKQIISYLVVRCATSSYNCPVI